MMLVALMAAISTAAGVIMDKIVLSYQKVGHRQFMIVLFFLLFVLCALLYPLFGKIDPRAFTQDYLILLILVIIVASIYNILFYHAIEKEKIVEVELIIMLSPLFTILIASIFLQAERNWGVFWAGIVASAALIFSHFNHHHFTFDVFQKGLLFCLLLCPIEAVLIKNLLFVYSPLALYLIRTFGIFIVLVIWYFFIAPYFKGEPKPLFSKWTLKNWIWCFIITVLAVFQMVLTYYAYSSLGVVFTTIVLTLVPILVYLASIVILKERLEKRIILAAVIILICIVYAHVAVGT